jgi:hypothetical protein
MVTWIPKTTTQTDAFQTQKWDTPTQKVSMISNVTVMFSDYGTAAIFAGKQIEESPVKTGD